MTAKRRITRHVLENSFSTTKTGWVFECSCGWTTPAPCRTSTVAQAWFDQHVTATQKKPVAAAAP